MGLWGFLLAHEIRSLFGWASGLLASGGVLPLDVAAGRVGRPVLYIEVAVIRPLFMDAFADKLFRNPPV